MKILLLLIVVLLCWCEHTPTVEQQLDDLAKPAVIIAVSYGNVIIKDARGKHVKISSQTLGQSLKRGDILK